MLSHTIASVCYNRHSQRHQYTYNISHTSHLNIHHHKRTRQFPHMHVSLLTPVFSATRYAFTYHCISVLQWTFAAPPIHLQHLTHISSQHTSSQTHTHTCVIYRYRVCSHIVHFRHQLPPYDPLMEPTHAADTLPRLHKPCIGLRTTFSQIHTRIYPHHLTFSSQFLTSHAYTSTPHEATRATFAPHMPCTCVRTLPEH